MTKQEFIDRLRAALSGRVSPGIVEDNVNYYQNYINTEILKGRTEEEVLASLGDPRLIARTIVETNAGTEKERYQGGESGEAYSEYRQYYDAGNKSPNKVFRVPGWVWVLAVVLVVLLLFSLAFSILSFFMPVILPILLIVFLVKLFRDWLN
nr:DUF1700 domain-containing protein [uncultured Acetatifactor sp.]